MSNRTFLNESNARSAPGTRNGNTLSVQEQAVLDAIRATPYGSVEVVLHQSRIVQVVKTEKVKLDAGPLER